MSLTYTNYGTTLHQLIVNYTRLQYMQSHLIKVLSKAIPIAWWPKQTPKIGHLLFAFSIKLRQTPASLGVHGPGEIIIPDVITVNELASRLAEKSSNLIKELMKLGVMATINQTIDGDTAELLVIEFGHIPKRVSESDVEVGLALMVTSLIWLVYN